MEVLKSHLWLVATILVRTDTGYFITTKILLNIADLEQ